MPAYQMFMHSLNRVTGYDLIGELELELSSPEIDWAAQIERLPELEGLPGGLDQGELQAGLAALIDSWPYSIQHGLREVIRGAMERNVGVTFAWRAAYDYKLEITESLDSRTTHGGITVVIESPYPPELPSGSAS